MFNELILYRHLTLRVTQSARGPLKSWGLGLGLLSVLANPTNLKLVQNREPTLILLKINSSRYIDESFRMDPNASVTSQMQQGTVLIALSFRAGVTNHSLTMYLFGSSAGELVPIKFLMIKRLS